MVYAQIGSICGIVMAGLITFDKGVYSPGDKVSANFSNMTTEKTRLRGIELSLFAYEEIKITYQSGSGNSRSTHTSTERIDYGFSNLLIEPEQLQDQYVLEIIIPPEMPPTLHYDVYDLEINVVLGAEIKYDMSWASDDHVFVYADVNVSPGIQNQPVGISEGGLSLTLQNNVVAPPQMVPLSVEKAPDFDKRFRSIRIELHTEIEGFTSSRSEKNDDSMVLMTFDDIPQGRLDVEIPPVQYPTIVGSNFHFRHYLKLVVDIPLATDDNYLLPLIILTDGTKSNLAESVPIMDTGFSSGPQEMTCTSCGNAVVVGSKFCEKCGERV